jgi:hypothetical protein
LAGRERRWAVITQDGRHSWVGRHTDPTDAETVALTAALEHESLTGWLAVTEGVYYSDEVVTILMVRPLTGDGDWAAAAKAFLDRRQAASGQA